MTTQPQSPYGAPTAATTAPTTTHATTAAVPLVWLASAMVGLAGAGGIFAGLGFVIDDESSQGEMFDGLGTIIGIVIGGAGALLLGLAVLCTWLVARYPLAASLVLGVLGTLVAGAGAIVSAGFGFGFSLASIVLLAGVLVGGLGFGAALTLRR